MHRVPRYGIAVLVAVLVTGGVAFESHSIVLLAGIFVIYGVGVAVMLRYPALLWGRNFDSQVPSAVLSGGATFGVLSLAQGLGPEFHFGAGALGFGLTVFGVATGIWMADASDSGDG
ncbi:hypothetical protein ACFQH6_12915 [Halobacteriaceae archaeon GCM10025711]